MVININSKWNNKLRIMAKHIVKRKGHEEHFDERKVYASCFAACMNAQVGAKKAEQCADKATKEIKRWMKNKKEVASDQIFKQIIAVLKKQNKEAAFMYEFHRDIN